MTELFNKSQLNVAVLLVATSSQERTAVTIKQLFTMKPATWNVRLYVVTARYSDEARKAVAALGLDVKIVSAESSWTWSHSMAEAERAIDQPCDATMWLQDDVVIFQDTYKRIEEFRKQYPSAIVVGQFCDPESGNITRGGYKAVRGSDFHLTRISTETLPTDVDTFDGTLVLIPKSASDVLGAIDGKFAVSYAGYDYGFRAQRKRVRTLVLPGFYGTSTGFSAPFVHNEHNESNSAGNQRTQGFASFAKLLRRYAGWRWPHYVLVAFIRALFNKTP